MVLTDITDIARFVLIDATKTILPGFVAQVLVDVTGSTRELQRTLSTVRQILVEGKEFSTDAANAGLLGASVYTGVSAIVGYRETSNPYAKAMYSLSTSFSGSALANSGVALAAHTCGISRPAMYSEVLAGIFLHLGNKAHLAALMLEKKPIPPHLQSPLYLSREIRQVFANNYNNYGKDLAFVMSGGARGMTYSGVGVLKSIPIKTIGKYIVVSLSVYAYIKLLIASYRYGERFYKARKKNRLDRK